MEDQDDLIHEMRNSFAVALRLRRGMKKFPEARAGLAKLAAVHEQRVAALSSMICSAERLPALTEDFPRTAAG